MKMPKDVSFLTSQNSSSVVKALHAHQMATCPNLGPNSRVLGRFLSTRLLKPLKPLNPFIGYKSHIQYVTVSAKTVLNGTFSITRKTDLKYSSCCSSVVLDFSHARLTV